MSFSLFTFAPHSIQRSQIMQLSFALSALLATTSASTMTHSSGPTVKDMFHGILPVLSGNDNNDMSLASGEQPKAMRALRGRRLDDSWQPYPNNHWLIDQYHDKCSACMCKYTGIMWCNQSVIPDPAFMDEDGRGSNGCQEKKQNGETCGQDWECMSGNCPATWQIGNACLPMPTRVA